MKYEQTLSRADDDDDFSIPIRLRTPRRIILSILFKL